MAISRVGSQTGTNTVTLPAHQAGDLIVYFAYRDGSNTAPSLPGSRNWTPQYNGGANTNSLRVAYKIAAGSSETTGTFTNATSSIAVVYRGVNQSTPVGDGQPGGASSTTLSYTGLTLANSAGASWVVGFGGHRSANVAIDTAPTGLPNVTSVSDATDEAALFDSNGGVTAWTTQTAAVGGTSSGWRTYTLEIRHADVAPLAGAAGSFALAGVDAGTLAGRTLAGDAGAFELAGADAGYSDTIARFAGAPAPLPSLGLLLEPSGPVEYTLPADAGVVALTGEDAGLVAGLRLAADAEAFALAGQDAGLAYDPLGQSGNAAPLPSLGLVLDPLEHRTLVADAESFALGGQDATLTYVAGGLNDYTFAADAGEFDLTGGAASLAHGAPGAGAATGSGPWRKITQQADEDIDETDDMGVLLVVLVRA